MKACARLLTFGLWFVAVAALAPVACAAEIRVPLTIPYLTLGEALKARLYNGPGHRADLWRESECQYFYAENPRFSRDGALLRLESDANLNVGTRVGPQCINAISWQGIVQAVATPYVTPDWKLKFRFRDLNLYNWASIRGNLRLAAHQQGDETITPILRFSTGPANGASPES